MFLKPIMKTLQLIQTERYPGLNHLGLKPVQHRTQARPDHYHPAVAAPE